MMRLDNFRRLCVLYGEARAKHYREGMPEDYTEAWRKECAKLWAKIEIEERDLNHLLFDNPTYSNVQT